MTHRLLATAGHVDHGKSTLLRALTGAEPDRLAEEQRRGLTIELGYVWTTLPGTPQHPSEVVLAFVDVPGHERFIDTMLAGAGPIPGALLVVAADDGWSAQSEEHLDVLDLLDVPLVAVAVTKVDLVDDARRAEVEREVTAAVSATGLEHGPVVAVDGAGGAGLATLRAVLRDRLAELPLPADTGRPRVWVDRVFVAHGAGTVVTGTLADGSLSDGAELTVLPGRRPARVRGLQALGRPVARAAAGERVAVNLGGVGHDEVTRGDVLVGGGPWRTTTTIDAVARVLPGRVLGRKGAWHLHVGSARTTCRVLPLAGEVAAAPDARVDVGPVGQRGRRGVTGPVRLLLEDPLVVRAGDRLVLREAGSRRTVAGAVVADPSPRSRPRGTRARAEHARALRRVVEATDVAGRLSALVALHGGIRRTAEALAAAGWSAAAGRPAGLGSIGDHLVEAAVVTGWEASVRSLGPGTHDRDDVAACAGAPAELAGPLAAHLVARGTLARTRGGYVLAEHADAATLASEERTAAVREALLRTPFAPPPIEEVAQEHGLDHRELTALVQAGELVRCGDVVFAREAVTGAVDRLRALAREVGPFTAAQARDALGTSRRYVVPLLEHLAASGVTRFDGRHHHLAG